MRQVARTVAILLAALSLSLGVYTFFYRSENQIEEGFETGLGAWTADADVPMDPNNPGHPIQWRIELTGNRSYTGKNSVLLVIDGSQDDGTIWIERTVRLRSYGHIKVKLSFQLYSTSQSFNTIAAVVAYCDISSPEREADFAVLGSANQLAGWKQYSYETQVDTDSSGTVWLGIGISVRWETSLAYWIDDVEISLTDVGKL